MRRYGIGGKVCFLQSALGGTGGGPDAVNRCVSHKPGMELSGFDLIVVGNHRQAVQFLFSGEQSDLPLADDALVGHAGAAAFVPSWRDQPVGAVHFKTDFVVLLDQSMFCSFFGSVDVNKKVCPAAFKTEINRQDIRVLPVVERDPAYIAPLNDFCNFL